MAGRHASRAPLLLTRAVTTVLAAAVLLAIGVLAVTVLFSGGGAPAPSRDDAAEVTVESGPDDAAPTDPSDGSTTETSEEPTVPAVPTPTTSGPATVAGAQGAGGPARASTAIVDAGAAGPGTTTGRPSPATVPPPRVPVGLATTAPGVGRIPAPLVSAPVGPPALTDGGVARGVGWWMRSDSGREHGRAVGLLGRSLSGCEPGARGHSPAPKAKRGGCR